MRRRKKVDNGRPSSAHGGARAGAVSKKRATVRSQLRILKAFGTFDFDPAYDYKAERRAR